MPRTLINRPDPGLALDLLAVHTGGPQASVEVELGADVITGANPFAWQGGLLQCPNFLVLVRGAESGRVLGLQGIDSEGITGCNGRATIRLASGFDPAAEPVLFEVWPQGTSEREARRQDGLHYASSPVRLAQEADVLARQGEQPTFLEEQIASVVRPALRAGGIGFGLYLLWDNRKSISDIFGSLLGQS